MPIIAAWCLGLLYIPLAAVSCLPWLTDRGTRPSWSEWWLAASFGLCTGGIGWLIGLEIGNGWPMAASLAAVALPALVNIWRRGRLVLPLPTRPPALLAAVAAVWIAPFLVGAWRMAFGAFPHMFFNVDTPFRLIHARELIHAARFPPVSLSNLGVVAGNHYGAPAAVAAVAAITGLPVHAAMFGIVVPCGAAGILAATILLIAPLVKGARVLGVCGLALALTAWVWPVPDLFASFEHARITESATPLADALSRIWSDPQSFNNFFQDVTQLFGRTLFLAACIPLVNRSRRLMWAAAFAVVLLGQVKTGLALIGLIALAVAALDRSIAQRHPAPLLVPAIALVGAAALVRVGHVDALFEMAFQPLWMVRHFPSAAVSHAGSFVLLVVIPVLAGGLVAGFGELRPGLRRAAPLIATVCLVYAMFNIIGANWEGRSWSPGLPPQGGPAPAFIESLLQVPILFALATVAIVGPLWSASWRARAAVAISLALIVLPAFAHRVHVTELMILSPQDAHEQVDNRAIAAALRRIPLAGSVIATNDLRYPANNYARDLMQYQIPAVFGHQAFGLPGYDRYPDWDARVRLQRDLAKTSVSCDTLTRLAADGVTHILVHTNYPHPQHMDLPEIYEGSTYQVYALRRPLACAASARQPAR